MWVTFNWRKHLLSGEHFLPLWCDVASLSLSPSSTSCPSSPLSSPSRPWNLYAWPRVAPSTPPHPWASCRSSAGWCYILLTVLLECERSTTLFGDSWSGGGLWRGHENGVNISRDSDFSYSFTFLRQESMEDNCAYVERAVPLYVGPLNLGQSASSQQPHNITCLTVATGTGQELIFVSYCFLHFLSTSPPSKRVLSEIMYGVLSFVLADLKITVITDTHTHTSPSIWSTAEASGQVYFVLFLQPTSRCS